MDELGRFNPNSVAFCILFASVVEVSRLASLVDFVAGFVEEASCAASLFEPAVPVKVSVPARF